ncbi:MULTISPECIES: alpha/beta fold hydrolase [Brevibacillus]|jgi:Predicted hydrolases or acyltransferases (alpha/beta hydrolase superfamily)|uniref:Alpha/beta hydrolase fold protein n=1 Tax=Brevibacillus borstelensis AK1 TaxID=1300222 RepID=M8DT57_9BACL|nr:alpha/beta hydrolase [Brevibacillus borstelensis]EMT50101.1 alpha/beta hydrolase fold protein [Brevibacillus borstelensis AK1]KKX52523.1 alpha/beta hydrolase [Brevibacillus borstelensis cifa_chp40]MBE5393743.1 alpha/beta hydrolase [Brevibacillus borstelensis]MCC0566770.1 alpha/beta hydrolase [Brevibacillus borstelensis]MCM3473285.1 alpha/beta hydrolase [Brevibacillus borstelensis]
MGYYVAVEQNVNLYVEDLDPGNGKPVLFIHGWPVNHKMYEYQFNQLPQMGYRCIGVDLRGFGKSDRPWRGYSYDRLADDIRVVIDTLELENITLAGFSMGGAIAIRYMARYGADKVSKLALFAAAAPLFTRRPDYPYGMTKEQVNSLIQATYTDRPKMLNDFGDMFFASYVTEGIKDWMHGLGMEASGHATAMCAVSLRDEDLRRDLSAVSVPTAIFHGVQDKVCPYPFAEFMHAGIQGSELVPFLYSGHGLFYDELEKFNRELVSFLAK